jgi:hypothetical protein
MPSDITPGDLTEVEGHGYRETLIKCSYQTDDPSGESVRFWGNTVEIAWTPLRQTRNLKMLSDSHPGPSQW